MPSSPLVSNNALSFQSVSAQSPASLASLPTGLNGRIDQFTEEMQYADPNSKDDIFQLRRLSSLPPVESINTHDKRIKDLWGFATTVFNLPASVDKLKALNELWSKSKKLMYEENIAQSDYIILQSWVNPLINKNLSESSLVIRYEQTSHLVTRKLEVTKLTNSQFSWDINFKPSGALITAAVDSYDLRGRLLFMGPNKKDIFMNTDANSEQAQLFKLDITQTQFIGSDAPEFVIVVGQKPTYNIATMGGDDVIRIECPSLAKDSVINIFGGKGKNTYVISFKDSWNPLSNTIHIWDFDPTKDSIIFDSKDGTNPNLTETKRTLFASTYSQFYSHSIGHQLEYNQLTPQADRYMAPFINFYRSYFAYRFTGAEHEFRGEGIPTIVLDVTNYDAKNPDGLFNSNALRTVVTAKDIGDSVKTTKTTLDVSEKLDKYFSQLDSSNDHDVFKIHLKAGNSYVFTMFHKPFMTGDAVLNTSLVLKDNNGNSVFNSNLLTSTKFNGDSIIDYVALKDGDFYLDASGSATGGYTVLNSKYEIRSMAIPHIDAYPLKSNGRYSTSGSFDGVTNRVGFKMSLSAGDYMELDFLSNKTPVMSIIGNNGEKVTPPLISTQYENKQIFLAQTTGNYFIDATLRDRSTSEMSYTLITTKNKDIEGSKDTYADLSINTDITSNINSKSDHDWFRVELDAWKTYKFEASSKNPSDRLPVHLSLKSYTGLVQLNNNLNVVDSIDKTGNFHSKMTWTPVASDTYYIDVYAATGSKNTPCNGDYSLRYYVI